MIKRPTPAPVNMIPAKSVRIAPRNEGALGTLSSGAWLICFYPSRLTSTMTAPTIMMMPMNCAKLTVPDLTAAETVLLP